MPFTRNRFALWIVTLLTALSAPATALADDPPAPDAVTLAATDVSATSAKLNGKAVTNGTPTVAYFIYGVAPDQLLARTPDTTVSSNPGEIPFSAVVTLKANTKYYFRAVAENDDWVVAGNQLDLTTLAPPELKGAAETDVTYKSATVHVTATTHGGPVTVSGEVTAAGVAPTKLGPVTVTADGDVAFPVSGLVPETTYRWTVIASGAGGLAGARGSFRTANLLPTPPVALVPAAVAYGTTVTARGTLVGGSNLTVGLVEQPFPFTAPIAPVAGVTTTSDGTGAFAFSIRAVRPTSFGVTAEGFKPVNASIMTKLKVFPVATAKVKRAARNRFVVSGSYQPAGVAAKASLYRRSGVKVGTAVSTTGAFRFPARALKAGKYEVRIVPAATTGYDAAKSTTLTVPKVTVKKHKHRR